MSIDPAAQLRDPVKVLIDQAEVVAAMAMTATRRDPRHPLRAAAKELRRAAQFADADRDLFAPALPTQANLDVMHERDIGGES